MKILSRTRSANGGYTLLEAAIVVGIIGLIMGSLTSVFDASSGTYGQGSTMARVQNSSRRVLDRVSMELENAGFGTLLPNPNGIACNDMAFQIATGIDTATSTIVWGPSTRLRFVYEAAELNNGLDDDGDGLVDEGCVELTRNYLMANQLSVILARGVSELLEGELDNGADDNGNGLSDERGFCMTRTGNLLNIRITMAQPIRGGNAAVATVETAIRLKN